MKPETQRKKQRKQKIKRSLEAVFDILSICRHHFGQFSSAQEAMQLFQVEGSAEEGEFTVNFS